MAGYNIYEFRKGRRTVLVAIALVFLWDTRENGIRIQGIYTLLERKMADDDDVDVRCSPSDPGTYLDGGRGNDWRKKQTWHYTHLQRTHGEH